MARIASPPDTNMITLRLRPVVEMDEEQFFRFCRLNDELRIERTAEGDVQIMPPTGEETGWENAILTAQLTLWALRDGSGRAYDSSTGFMLPNGAVRSPDASWIPRWRLEQFTQQQRQRFLPLCPDFVAELRSPSDSLETLQEKMQEYVRNGARLGWLIDPLDRRVHVYRPDAEVQVLDDPAEVSAEPELPGFRLELATLWGKAP